MVDRLVAVDDADYRLPEPVLAATVDSPENDQAVADFARAASSALNSALTELTWLNVRNFGAVGDGVHDDSDAIEAAENACLPGQAVYFPRTSAYYLITRKITITTTSIRFIGQPRDAYSVSIRCSTPGVTMLEVKAGGFVLENLGLIGDASGPSQGVNGEGATVVGLALFGDIDGNLDCAIRGSTFQYLALGIRLYGRNAEISQNTLFSNCLNGVRHAGKDATYHTGPAADQNRGHVIRDSRFHNIGTSDANAAIEFTSASNLLHAIIDGNHVDSGGKGRHIVVSGSAVSAARGLTIFNHKSTEVTADAITLEYCQYPVVENVAILGVNGAGGHGIVLTNTLYAVVDGVTMRGIGKDGIRGTGNTSPTISNVKMVQVGADTAAPGGSAYNFNSTNSDVKVVNPSSHVGSGWFWTGSPTGDSVIIDGSYSAFTLGGIDSTTVANHSKRGRNSYVEGRAGRIEDTGYGHYDLAAGVARSIATATAGNNFGAFILDIEITGRDGTVGSVYFSGKRYVRPENGTNIVTTLGTDASAGITVSVTASGTAGVSVVAQTTNANWIGARVRAVAGGGPSGSVSRAVTVTMAAQP